MPRQAASFSILLSSHLIFSNRPSSFSPLSLYIFLSLPLPSVFALSFQPIAMCLFHDFSHPFDSRFLVLFVFPSRLCIISLLLSALSVSIFYVLHNTHLFVYSLSLLFLFVFHTSSFSPSHSSFDSLCTVTFSPTSFFNL